MRYVRERESNAHTVRAPGSEISESEMGEMRIRSERHTGATGEKVYGIDRSHL